MKRLASLMIISVLFLSACVSRRDAVQTAALPAESENAEETPILLCGNELERDAETLRLEGGCDADELRTALAAMEQLQLVEWQDCPLSTAERLELRKAYPALRFDWTLQLGNVSFSALAEEVDLSAAQKNIPALLELLPLMSAQSVDLSGWSIGAEDAAALREAEPERDFLYTVELFDRSFSSLDTEIDLSDIPMEDTAAVEAALVFFPKLEKVLMLRCGLDNDTMDALNARHEGTRFVWLVQVMTLSVRSDTTYFTIYNAEPLYQPRQPVANLRYCHDLIAVDLGHCGISQEDLEFARGTPKLQFLILAECYIHDLEPLRCCPELRYLEAFKSYLNDISALADCPKLTDLNLCYIPSLGPDCVPILKEMKQLEHLWFCDANFSSSLIVELRDALPDTEFLYYKGPESTGAGWRTHDIYYEMRDALHMPYMN